MCEYCDLYDKHREYLADMVKAMQTEMTFLEAIRMLMYTSAFLDAGFLEYDPDEINKCFNAGFDRGNNQRVQTEESEKKPKPN